MALNDNQKRSSVGVSFYSMGPGVDPTNPLNDNTKQSIAYGMFGLLGAGLITKVLMWFKK